VSLETDIVTSVSSMFSGGLSPDTAPAAIVYPFAIYQQVGGIPISTFCGDATRRRNAVLQFWVWSKTRNECNTLMHALHAVLTEAPFRAVSQSGLMAEYNEVTRTYGAVQRFSFWA
jgi:hypothetical protein